jgi:hypothetical protein
MLWKSIFHRVENIADFFHTVEPYFPHGGTRAADQCIRPVARVT